MMKVKNDELQAFRIVLEVTQRACDQLKDREIARLYLQLALTSGMLNNATFKAYEKLVKDQIEEEIDFNVQQLKEIVADLEKFVFCLSKATITYQSFINLIEVDALKQFIQELQPSILGVCERIKPELKQQFLEKNRQVLKKVDDQDKILQHLKSEKKKKETQHSPAFQNEQRPRNRIKDFQSIPVIPTIEELKDPKRSELVPMIVKGKYEDLEDYMSTLYTLLREDYCRDFKEGLQSYLSQKDQQNLKTKQINLYKSAQIKDMFISQDFMGLTLRIDVSQTKFLRRKLMIGSLIVISPDFFDKVIVYGIIRNNDVEVNEKLIKTKGYMELSIEVFTHSDSDIQAHEIYSQYLNSKVVIIESKAFFEAYFHSLCLLKQNQDFQLSKFIIGQDFASLTTPTYLQSEKVKEMIDQCIESSTLDQSQSIAFKAAFNQQISLIQGPPGTGKTFIGIKICETLLKCIKRKETHQFQSLGAEKKINQSLATGPIIVTCYTNHALDQFLSNIITMTTKVVRIGGQCKIKDLKQYTLQEQLKRPDIIKPNVQKYKETKLERDYLNIKISRKKEKLEVIDETHIFPFFKNADEDGFPSDKKHTSLPQYSDVQYSSLLIATIESSFNTQLNKLPKSHYRQEFMEYIIQQLRLKQYKELTWLGLLNLSAVHEQFVNFTEKKTVGFSTEEIVLNELRDIVATQNMQFIDILSVSLDSQIGSKRIKGKLEIAISHFIGIKNVKELLKFFKNNQVIFISLKIIKANENKTGPIQFRSDQFGYVKTILFERSKTAAIEELALNFFEFDEDSLLNFANEITFNDCSLRQLDLSHNNISKNAAKSFVSTVLQSKLTELNISDNLFAAKEFQIFFEKQLNHREDFKIVFEEEDNQSDEFIEEEYDNYRQNIQSILEKKSQVFQKTQTPLDKYVSDHLAQNLRSFTKNYKSQEFQSELQQTIELKKLVIKGKEIGFEKFTPQEKWSLNNLLVNDRRMKLKKKLIELFSQIDAVTKIINKLHEERITLMLQEQDVIACTTTGAAKFKSLLSGVFSQIMIVEEAGQISEPHLVTALTKSTEQLIMIGDHEQLRPNYQVYDLKSKYNFNISMFERLIRNDFPSTVLHNQRRMRPEISLIPKLIYPNLIDDKSVELRPAIPGISSPVFFINHKFMDENYYGTTTKVNKSEADFVIRLTDYLIKQNISPEKITILSLYAGQLFYIREIMKQKLYQEQPLQQVIVTTVDNFQGEENDIIILSCVRSNQQKRLGFLTETNRVNVALSRARLGLYIIGNADMIFEAAQVLKGDSPHFWCKVIDLLDQQNQLGEALVLKCQNHANINEVKTPEDFTKVPEGGCNIICNVRMPCGHSCDKMCHNYEKTKDDQTGHQMVKCLKQCERKQDCGHPCQCQCFECKDQLQSCKTKVVLSLDCGHEKSLLCYQANDDQLRKCQVICERELKCGHTCRKPCFADCDFVYEKEKQRGYSSMCKEQVPKLLPCGHTQEIDCGQDPQMYFQLEGCKVECQHILPCSHKCPLNCGKCFGKIQHGQCSQPCERMLICNHLCKDKCCNSCPACQVECEISCKHSKCPQKCGDICTPCIEDCESKCTHSECTKKCFELCDRSPCQKSCDKVLDCWHPCIGFCGEPCPQVCRKPGCKYHQKEVFQMNLGFEEEPNARFVLLTDCGHIIEEKGLAAWMNKQLDSEVISYPKCPVCSQSIKNCQRFQNEIKLITQKVNAVKTIIQKKTSKLEESIKKLDFSQMYSDYRRMIDRLESKSNITKEAHTFFSALSIIIDNVQKLQINLPQTLKNQTLDMFEVILTKTNFFQFLIDSITNYIFNVISFQDLYAAITHLKPFVDLIQSAKPTEEELQHVESILKTFRLYLDIKIEVQSPDSQRLGEIEKQMMFMKFEVNDEEYIKFRAVYLEYKENKIKAQKLKEEQKAQLLKNMEERKLIVSIPNLQGKWYSCPNNHYYVVSKCGKAVEKGKCPECGEAIGGKNKMQLKSNKQVNKNQIITIQNQ